MGHVYGNLDTFRRWISGGDASRDPEMLTVLEASSRAVDAFCQRGSGFGPVIETRTYRSHHRHHLLLRGDLQDIDALTVNDAAVTPLPTITARTRTLDGYRGTIAVTGPWTYDYQTVPVGALEAIMADDATSFDLSDTAGYAAGMTLLVDDEQLLVIAVTDTTVSVVRGVNGTVATAHADESRILTYRYASEVVDATYRVAQRRWRQRDAGITGSFGGGQDMAAIPGNVDTEWSILLSTVNHLRFVLVR